MRKRMVRGTLVLLLALVLLIPETAAGAAPRNTTHVSIVGGKVVSGGANITVRYDCFPSGYTPYNSFGDVRVGQVSGVTGDGQFHPLCNDRFHSQAVFVPGAFTKGDAAVNVFICGFDCNSASREIKLR